MTGASSADDEVAALAKKREVTTSEVRTMTTTVVFRTGERWVAVPVNAINEVVTKPYVTRVPWAPAEILGVALIRGQVVPVVSLEGLLGSESARPDTLLPRLVVIDVGENRVALSADHTFGIVELPRPAARSAHALVTDVAWNGRIVLLLDVEALVAHLEGKAS